jgi:hypothetical protein
MCNWFRKDDRNINGRKLLEEDNGQEEGECRQEEIP